MSGPRQALSPVQPSTWWLEGSETCEFCLQALRPAEAVIPASDLEAPSGRALAPKERQMGERFIKALEEDFEPERYRDEYRERVALLIEIKRRGGTVEPEAYPERPPSDELLELLEASLEAVS